MDEAEERGRLRQSVWGEIEVKLVSGAPGRIRDIEKLVLGLGVHGGCAMLSHLTTDVTTLAFLQLRVSFFFILPKCPSLHPTSASSFSPLFSPRWAFS